MISIAMDTDLIIEVGALVAPLDVYEIEHGGEDIRLCFGFGGEARHVVT